MRASSSAVRGPVVSQPDRSVSATASISASVIAGGWNERKVSSLRGELPASAVTKRMRSAAASARATASSRDSPVTRTAPARSAPRRSGVNT